MWTNCGAISNRFGDVSSFSYQNNILQSALVVTELPVTVLDCQRVD